MILLRDFLNEMGIEKSEMRDYRKYLAENVSTVESFNSKYKDIVLNDLANSAAEVYGDQFIDIYKCVGCRYIIFEKNLKGIYKLYVKTFTVRSNLYV